MPRCECACGDPMVASAPCNSQGAAPPRWRKPSADPHPIHDPKRATTITGHRAEDSGRASAATHSSMNDRQDEPSECAKNSCLFLIRRGFWQFMCRGNCCRWSILKTGTAWAMRALPLAYANGRSDTDSDSLTQNCQGRVNRPPKRYWLASAAESHRC